MNTSSPGQFARVLKWLGVVCTVGAAALAAAAGETAGADGPATIRLTNGSHATGKLATHAGGDRFVWQSPGFISPFVFPLDAVNVVHFPVGDEFPQPTGDYCFELAEGDILFGELLSLDIRQAVLEVGGIGRLHVERRVLRRILRWDLDKDLGSEEMRLAAADVPDAFVTADGDVEPRLLRAVLRTGMRVSGELVRVDEQGVWIKCPGIQEPIVSPVAAIQALTVLSHRGDPPQISGRQGRLQLAGAVLRGSLVDGKEGEASCLVWQPTYSTAASAIVRGVAARIVYRDPPPPAVPVRQERRVRVFRAAPGLQQLESGRATTTSPLRAFSSGQSVLHLRSGDTFQCAVSSINEKGVNLKSALTSTTFVPNAEIKVLDLLPGAGAVAIALPKKERLLTLPRMQRDNPPTQLIRSTSGDYLRGRLVGMDAKELSVEIRLETKTVPRANVARIIWLHPDEIDASAALAVAPAAVTRVQVLPADGNRLTFSAEQVHGSTLSGKSDLLGTCRVDLQKIDQLLIGAAIEQTAAKLALHQWKLKPALDPLAAEEGEPGDREGLLSALVGKPAPSFELELLDGGKFRLAEGKGRVIVLGFWASWCGPCLQVMPQVDAVVREFAADNVRLVSINQQETPERIRTVIDRLGLSTAVALDHEGIVAEWYGAITIPQTVIIDREGNVARVFTSTSARFDEQFRAALQSVLDGAESTD